MKKEEKEAIVQAIAKIKGGKKHFFAYHPGKTAQEEPRLALDPRKRPRRSIMEWKYAGLAPNHMVEGRVRMGQTALEFVTAKEPAGGPSKFSLKLKKLEIPQLKTAALVVDPEMDMHEEEGEEPVGDGLGGWPDAFAKAEARAQELYASSEDLRQRHARLQKHHDLYVEQKGDHEYLGAAATALQESEDAQTSLAGHLKVLSQVDLSLGHIQKLKATGDVDRAALVVDQAQSAMKDATRDLAEAQKSLDLVTSYLDLAVDLLGEVDPGQEERSFSDWTRKFKKAEGQAKMMFAESKEVGHKLGEAQERYKSYLEILGTGDVYLDQVPTPLKEAAQAHIQLVSSVRDLARVDLSPLALEKMAADGDMTDAQEALDSAADLVSQVQTHARAITDNLDFVQSLMDFTEDLNKEALANPVTQPEGNVRGMLKKDASLKSKISKGTYSKLVDATTAYDGAKSPQDRERLRKEILEDTEKWFDKNLDRFHEGDQAKLSDVWAVHQRMLEGSDQAPSEKDRATAVKVLGHKVQMVEGKRPVDLGAAQKLGAELEKWISLCLEAEDMDSMGKLNELYGSLNKLSAGTTSPTPVESTPQVPEGSKARSQLAVGKAILEAEKALDAVDKVLSAWMELDKHQGHRPFEVRGKERRVELEKLRNGAPDEAVKGLSKITKGARADLPLVKKWLKVAQTHTNPPVNPTMIPGFAEADEERQAQILKDVSKKVESGKNLVATLLKDPSLLEGQDRPGREVIADICWYLRSLSEDVTDSAWSAGAITIPDPDGVIQKFLDNSGKVYPRDSTHLKKSDKSAKGGQARGIDFYEGAEDDDLLLPYGMKTLLYQEHKRDGQSRLYIKMETQGCRSWSPKPQEGAPKPRPTEKGDLSHTLKHGMNIFSFLKEKDKSGMDRRGEKFKDLPKQVQSASKALGAELKHKDNAWILKELKKAGVPLDFKGEINEIALAIEAVQNVLMDQKRVMSQAPNTRVDELFSAIEVWMSAAEDAWGEDMNLDLRVGDEVVLTSDHLLGDKTPQQPQQQQPQQPQQQQPQQQQPQQQQPPQGPPPPAPVVYNFNTANPTLYFQPNSANGYNYTVSSANPGQPWQRVEQFCAWLATQWLANPTQGGLSFGDLNGGQRQSAVDTLVQWGANGLQAQVNSARVALNGQVVPANTVQGNLTQNAYGNGQKFWFGSNVHAMAATIHGPDQVWVYDPNPGTVTTRTFQQFSGDLQGKTVVVG